MWGGGVGRGSRFRGMARRVVVLTGAGVSAESGLKTFRDDGGLWEGERVEDVATPEAWRRDAGRVWAFYQKRRQALMQVEPNRAHEALARLQVGGRAEGMEVEIFTQNVDDLHERAGASVRHVHGELTLLRCEMCGAVVRDRTSLDAHVFVACAGCGHARLRPDIVWFGEIPYFQEEVESALESCDVFLAIGTSGAVYPAAGWLQVARSRGARTVVQALEAPINLGARDEFVAGRAVERVPEIVRELLRE